MTTKPPPVPPANRSRKVPGSATEPPRDTSRHKPKPENLEDQGQQGTIAQNTTNQGYRQDR